MHPNKYQAYHIITHALEKPIALTVTLYCICTVLRTLLDVVLYAKMANFTNLLDSWSICWLLSTRMGSTKFPVSILVCVKCMCVCSNVCYYSK